MATSQSASRVPREPRPAVRARHCRRVGRRCSAGRARRRRRCSACRGLLAACGGDDDAGGGGGSAKAAVKLRHRTSPTAPARPTTALKAMADGFTPRRPASRSTVNTVDHNTFQESINNYLQGTPDDVFTWFAGYRMRFFAEKGLDRATSATSGRIDGTQRRLQEGLDRRRRQAVLRAGLVLPVGGLLPEVGLREERLRRRRRRIDELDALDEGHAARTA